MLREEFVVLKITYMVMERQSEVMCDNYQVVGL
jgi:hypothetical protein